MKKTTKKNQNILQNMDSEESDNCAPVGDQQAREESRDNKGKKGKDSKKGPKQSNTII